MDMFDFYDDGEPYDTEPGGDVPYDVEPGDELYDGD